MPLFASRASVPKRRTVAVVRMHNAVIAAPVPHEAVIPWHSADSVDSVASKCWSTIPQHSQRDKTEELRTPRRPLRFGDMPLSSDLESFFVANQARARDELFDL